MKFETISLVDKNIDKIEQIFPGVVTEVKDADGTIRKAVDFEALKAELSKDIVEGRECYEFTWAGKNEAKYEAAKPIRKTLRPCKEESKNWDTTQNLYIEGDNLKVLKLLQESYLNKVKMIYIDPPYNTGNDFIYKDDFRMKQSKYDALLDMIDEDGNRMSRNTDTEGRLHSDWCSMIYSRLKLARNLLSEDGVIFISIDDNEVANLKKICDEIFGNENFVAQFPWRKRTAKSDVPFGVSQDYEWIISYSKTENFFACIEGKERKYYSSPDFPGRPWRVHDLTSQRNASERPNSFFTIINPKTQEEYPANPNRTWALTKDTFERYLAQGKIVFPGDYDFLSIQRPAFRYFKDEDILKSGDLFGTIPFSTKLSDEVGMSLDGTKEITELFKGKIFSFPKPTSLIKAFLNAVFCRKKDGIVLDFFSGSATTAHAVMQLNAEDSGKRKFVMVQLPEKCDENSEAKRAGFDNICEIGKERIRRAGEKIKQEYGEKAENLDIGFRVFKLDSTNMKDVYYTPAELTQDLLAKTESNIKDDRTDMDLLYGCLLDWGLELSMPHETKQIDGVAVHYVNQTDLIACFNTDVPEAVIRKIAADKPLRVVFRDSCFKNVSDKTNVDELFKAISPETQIKVI